MYKRIIAYHLLFLFLLCTFQVGITNHLCCGKVASTKFFIGSGKASCGMEDSEDAVCASNPKVKNDCCKDVLKKFQFQNDFNAPFFKIKISNEFNFLPFFFKESYSKILSSYKLTYSAIKPPPEISISKNSLSRLQIFRI